MASSDDDQARELTEYLERQRQLPENQPKAKPATAAETVPASLEKVDYFARNRELFVERENRRLEAGRYSEWSNIVSSRGRRYANCSLADLAVYDPNPEAAARHREAIAQVSDFIDHMEANLKTGYGLVLFGTVGTGKDHFLAAALRIAVLDFRASARWMSGADFFGDVRDAMDSGDSERTMLRRYIDPAILVISDPLPPFGNLTQHQATMLFRIIDGRYSRGAATWVSINVASSIEAGERMGASTMDRLRHGALTIHCAWESYRGRK